MTPPSLRWSALGFALILGVPVTAACIKAAPAISPALTTGQQCNAWVLVDVDDVPAFAKEANADVKRAVEKLNSAEASARATNAAAAADAADKEAGVLTNEAKQLSASVARGEREHALGVADANAAGEAAAEAELRSRDDQDVAAAARAKALETKDPEQVKIADREELDAIVSYGRALATRERANAARRAAERLAIEVQQAREMAAAAAAKAEEGARVAAAAWRLSEATAEKMNENGAREELRLAANRAQDANRIEERSQHDLARCMALLEFEVKSSEAEGVEVRRQKHVEQYVAYKQLGLHYRAIKAARLPELNANYAKLADTVHSALSATGQYEPVAAMLLTGATLSTSSVDLKGSAESTFSVGSVFKFAVESKHFGDERKASYDASVGTSIGMEPVRALFVDPADPTRVAVGFVDGFRCVCQRNLAPL